jgi:hypothetical protein
MFCLHLGMSTEIAVSHTLQLDRCNSLVDTSQSSTGKHATLFNYPIVSPLPVPVIKILRVWNAPSLWAASNSSTRYQTLQSSEGLTPHSRISMTLCCIEE